MVKKLKFDVKKFKFIILKKGIYIIKFNNGFFSENSDLIITESR